MKNYIATYTKNEGIADSVTIQARSIKDAKNFAQAFKSRNNIKGITKVNLSK
jgi:ABC-type branched-subunit amino acid transport system substrate-binding protein